MTVLTYSVRLYRRDTRELPRGARWGLVILRVATFVGLLVFFFNLQKRTELEEVRTSRVAVLIDTSQSMGLSDAKGPQRETRLDRVVDALSQGQLLRALLKKHDVTVYRFDQTAAPTPIAAFHKRADLVSDTAASDAMPRLDLLRAQQVYAIAMMLALIALGCLVGQVLFGRRIRGAEGEAYLLLAGTTLLIASLILAGTTNLRYPQFSMAQVLGGAPVKASGGVQKDVEITQATEETSPDAIDWETELAPRGIETRLGEALRWTLDKERDGPLAGIIVVTDGCHNAGVTPESVVAAAQAANVPLFPVGMGSEKSPRSVRVVDLELPPRVYPGDRFTVIGYLQANGLSGRTMDLSLEQRTMDDQPTSLKLDRRVTLGSDGEILPVQFEVTPDSVGRFKWVLQAIANENDDLDARDNIKQGTVQVVERKSRVLILAGGPTREYRFLRNLLFRDPTTEVDVLLQSASAGAAQEANQVLLEFPRDRDAMFQYDCVVAFDPDWAELTREQIQLLDEWVAEKAGGLVVVAGPVYTNSWSRGSVRSGDEAKLRIVKDLYPVTFIGQAAASIQFGRVGSDTPWPLQFTDEGRRAQFLWLENSPTGSEQAWDQFEGIYGYQALRGVKPGAQVYARFSDPQAATQNEQPVYMAGQFYGAGRVFYLGSGEMWRLNALDPRYFETFYTKLIRHVSQGRLLRDSSRGVLLVDNERCSLGDTITVRAALADEQYRPLTLESVEAIVVYQDGSREPLRLRRLANSERPGMYTAQLTATREGDLRIDLAVPARRKRVAFAGRQSPITRPRNRNS